MRLLPDLGVESGHNLMINRARRSGRATPPGFAAAKLRPSPPLARPGPHELIMGLSRDFGTESGNNLMINRARPSAAATPLGGAAGRGGRAGG